MRPYLARLPVRWPTCLAVVCCLATALAQDRPSDESRRERWQKVDEILGEMLIHPGAIVADVGAGDLGLEGGARASWNDRPTGRVRRITRGRDNCSAVA